MTIEGIPEGWELVRVGKCFPGDVRVAADGNPEEWNSVSSIGVNYVIVRKIEKPRRYRSFANAAEYMQKRRVGVAVDWKNSTVAPGFHAVVSANEPFLWVAFGTVIERLEWGQAFEKLEFRHVDGSVSPFGVEVTE